MTTQTTTTPTAGARCQACGRKAIATMGGTLTLCRRCFAQAGIGFPR